MFIEVVKSKIHRVTVTEANLNYIGSITIDEDLLDAANLIANEKVSIVNVVCHDGFRGGENIQAFRGISRYGDK